MASLLFCITFYSSVMVLDSVIIIDHVISMNKLFSNPGWFKFSHSWEPLEITDRWMETKQQYDMRCLLAASANGQIVTKENADIKIRLAHQFLSCKYADVFKTYCEYERGIVHQCRRIENISQSIECLEIFLKKLIEDNDRLISRMRGALLFFYEIPPNNVYNKDVSEILEDFKKYYNANHFEGTTLEAGRLVIAQIDTIEQHIFNTVQRLSAFFNSHCWPVPYYENYNGISSARSDVLNITDMKTPSFAMHCIRANVKKVLDDIIELYYEFLGFEYNSELSTARIIYYPDTIPHVNKMNALLSFPGWLTMQTFGIMGNTRWIKMLKVLKKSRNGTIVRKKNVGYKIRHAHKFLSCEYVIVLKTCYDHLTGIANECSKIKDISASLDCWKQFWNTLKEIEPMVLRMRGALSYFYYLSPQIEYKKNVYEILGELKNHYESIVLSTNWFIKTTPLLVLKLSNTKSLITILRPLFEFFKQNCWSYPPLFDIIPAKYSPEYSINRRVDDFKELIKRFIESTYGSFGFTYDPVSDTTNVMEKSDDK